MNLIALMMLAVAPNGEPLPEVVLLDFTATWCGPCQQMVPVIQEMEKNGYPVRKIDTSKQPETFRQFGVERMPTFILLVNGKEEKRWQGLQSGEQLKSAMREARDRLHPVQERRAADEERNSSDERRPSVNEEAPQPPDEEEKRASQGLAGVFSRIRSRLGGDRPQKAGFEFPTFRGQSPQGVASLDDIGQRPLEATVRVRIPTAKGHEAASGTIVHSEAGKATILTCAHLFMNAAKDAEVEVDVFRENEVLTYPADVLDGNHDSDLAIIQIQTRQPLPSAAIAVEAIEVKPDDTAFSVGCNNGDRPTPLSMRIIDLNRYLGPDNIVCTSDPTRGRSGGGLFNSDGQLIGVCSCADRECREGLYMGRGPIFELFDKAGLADLLFSASEDRPPQRFAEVADPRDPFAASSDEKLIQSLFEEVPESSQLPDIDSDAGALVSTTANDDFPFRETPVVDGPPVRQPVVASQENAHARLATAMAAVGVAETPATAPVEVTVIVDSKQRSGSKQVIVIPNPSPWLLKILTGNTSPDHSLATARNNTLAPTSSSRGQQPMALKPLPFIDDASSLKDSQREAVLKNQPTRLLRTVSADPRSVPGHRRTSKRPTRRTKSSPDR